MVISKIIKSYFPKKEMIKLTLIFEIYGVGCREEYLTNIEDHR